jgi:uncharacterized protein YybS (DUF2232 family)
VAFTGKDAVLPVIKGGAATIVLVLVYLAVPILGMLSGIVSPFPALFYGIRNGIGTAAAIVALSAAVLAVLEPSGALLYLFQGGIVSLCLVLFLGRGIAGSKAVALTTAVDVGLIGISAAAFSMISGVNLQAFIEKGIAASIARTAEIYQKSGLSGEDLDAAKGALAESAALISRTYPAFVLIGIAAVAAVNLLLAARNSNLAASISVGPFRSYRNTDHLVWVLIAGGFALAFGTPLLKVAGLNLVLIAVVLYLVQGVAVITAFFDRYAVSRVMRIIFWVFFGLQPFLAMAVALLGLFDLWGNFRIPKNRTNL